MNRPVEWKVNQTERARLGRFEIIYETLALNDNKPGYYSFVKFSKVGVCILPIISSDEILLIKQYRRPLQKWIYELPAGTVDNHEEPVETAKRELLEETGYSCKEIVPCGYFYPSPGSTDEKIHLFMAHCSYTGPASPEENEHIECIKINNKAALRLLENNEIEHAAAIILLQRYLFGLFHV